MKYNLAMIRAIAHACRVCILPPAHVTFVQKLNLLFFVETLKIFCPALEGTDNNRMREVKQSVRFN